MATKSNFLYNLLIAPSYRVWRHLLLIAAFAIISLNQALMVYKNILPELGPTLWGIAAALLMTYLVVIYFILYVIVPHYLLTGRYLHFTVWIVLTAAAFLLLQNGMGLFFPSPSTRFTPEVQILDYVSSLLINILCLGGITIPVFLKNWMLSIQRVGRLEKEQIASEVTQMKEQINPSFLFAILRSASETVKTNARKASAMLMKLSRLLRYQLYDCNREKVLLSSELAFITTYLELEQLHSSSFAYSVTTGEGAGERFVPPLLLFAFVQAAVRVYEEEGRGTARVCTVKEGAKIVFSVGLHGVSESASWNEEIRKAGARLSALYGANHSLESPDKNPPEGLSVVITLNA